MKLVRYYATLNRVGDILGVVDAMPEQKELTRSQIPLEKDEFNLLRVLALYQHGLTPEDAIRMLKSVQTRIKANVSKRSRK